MTNNSFEKVKIITDESIKVGGCIIETNFGGVDATVLSQLEEIETELLDVDSDE